MGQTFRQGLQNKPFAPCGTHRVTWWYCAGSWTGLGSPDSFTHVSELDGAGWKAAQSWVFLCAHGASQSLHAEDAAFPAELSDFLHGSPGFCKRKELEAAGLQDLDPKLVQYHVCHIPVVKTSPDSRRRTV